ncbi:MAG TPA: squalene synthase HpnC [Patescibacteria group bacterium]|nr:squalene synthase HpnC [Patescibacteria group bacterium]
MTAVEHSSGKHRGSENFPVGSWLIAKPLRRHVHAFYHFARTADDIADACDLPAEEKLRRLDRMAAVLDGHPGEDAPAAAMRASLSDSGLTAVHCHDLLAAFRHDVTTPRTANWDALMAYCRLSAAPVGRYLLDLHGESRDGWPESDALCAALQVINHLQDCADDLRQMDRVYVPLDWLAAEGLGVDALLARRADAPLRRVLDRMIEATAPLVASAQILPACLRDRGLRTEAAVIAALAARLLDQLARRDPLAERVKLGPWSIVAATAGGILRGLPARGGRQHA